jgi:hypothetical protein
MGYQDNFPTMRAAEQAAFGSVITYTPAGGILPPFSTTGVWENFVIDEMGARVVRDVFTCRVLHSVLAEAGVIAPTIQTSSQVGDSITRKDINNADEVWVVTQAEPDQEYGEWVLTLEKSVRFIPT